jgi:hypothetical protein
MFYLVKPHQKMIKLHKNVQIMLVLNLRTNLLTKRLRPMRDLTLYSTKKIINTNDFSS